MKHPFTSRTSIFAALPLLAATASFAQTYNTLTEEEEAAGYELLFNGIDLEGWRGSHSMTPPTSWTVVAESTWNVIRNGSGSAIPLITSDDTYQDFDLKIEFNVPSAGNSGIFIRYNKFNVDSWGGASGPETQIAATNNSDGSHNLHRNGTAYDMFGLQPSATNWDRPNGTNNYGRYHQLRIVAYKNRIAHYGNGIKLLEYDMNSAAYNTAYLASKYSTYPDYRDVHPGAIYLQHHGETNVRFRNIRIKKLTESPWAEGSPYLANPADSSGGLRDSLTFEDNLFIPTGIAQGSRGPANRLKARVLRGADGVTLRLDRAGDYVVTVNGLNGRTVYSEAVRGNDRILLPASSFSGETRAVRVLGADGTAVFSSLVAPLVR